MQAGKIETPEGTKAPDPSSIYDPSTLKTEFTNIKDRITDVLAPMAQLEASGEQLAETFGFAGDRVTEMENQINKSASSLLQFSKNAMTYESALKRAGEIVKEVSIVTNRNVIASTDVIKSLEITAEATGVSTKDLAQNFTDVGFQLTDVQKQMSTAANVAQRLGVNVGAVTKGVSDNLKNLNIYNFQGGVEGLAKMVAKSAVLGVNMESVFNMAEKAFDPEQAIELAASMQRLGVTTSDLLDPLKIMDLGQNNPDELMKQITNVTKGLTKIDEKSGKVSILPGEQGRMRELAKAMDMPVAELAKMAIKSGELEYKMKKIAFPKMDIPMTEDNKEMIANLAQFSEKKGGFVVTVKDEDGKEQEKLVSELNPDDVAFLKEQATPKSLEKLAEDQLTVSQKMLKELEYISSGPRAGLSRSKEASEVRRNLDKTISKTKEGTFQKNEKGEDFYDKMEKSMGYLAGSLLKELPNALQSNLMKLVAGEEVNTDKLFGDLTNIGLKLKEGSISAGKELINVVQNAINNANQPTSTKTSETTATTTETKKPEENLTWFEQIDATMENYKKSLEPKTSTTTTPETKKEDTKQDLIRKEEDSMRKLLEQPTTKTETQQPNLTPIAETNILQTDRLIGRLDTLIDVTKQNKVIIDYDKFKYKNENDQTLLSSLDSLTKQMKECCSDKGKKLEIEKIEKPTIVENKEIKTTEIIKEKDIVEVKPEIPKIPETDFSSLISGFASNNDKLINGITELKNNLNPEPKIVENKEIKTNEIIKEKEFVEIKPEIPKIPEFDTNSIVSSMSNQTDKFVDNINSLKETTKENKMDIDYDKLKVQEKGEENYASIFEPIANKLKDFVSTQEKIIGIKSPEPKIVENKEVIIENNKIETEKKQNEPLLSNENKIDDKQLTDNISLMSENFLAKLEQFKEQTNKSIEFDYEKFNVNFSSKEKGKENLFDLESRLKDLSSKIEQKNIASNDTKPIPTKEGATDKKIETEDKVVQTKIETPEIKPFDFGPLTQTINLMSDKLSNNQLSIKDFKPDNKLEFNYQEFASKLPNDKNYGEILNPLSDKISSLITSTESQISGIKNLEPKTIEKQEFKETFIKENSPVAEIPKTEKIILPELNVKDKNFDSLPKITESKIPESAVRTNAEMSPVTMKTESTTNVGGEITLVVDVRGVQNDASRLIVDEVTKKIRGGEFTSALIGQIKNKKSAYGQLSGNQSSIIPGFEGGSEI